MHKGDFVLAHFASMRSKVPVKYVCFVEAILPTKKIFISWMKSYNNRKKEFVFPNVLQREAVLNYAIISILLIPFEKRGKYVFPYDVLRNKVHLIMFVKFC